MFKHQISVDGDNINVNDVIDHLSKYIKQLLISLIRNRKYLKYIERYRVSKAFQKYIRHAEKVSNFLK